MALKWCPKNIGVLVYFHVGLQFWAAKTWINDSDKKTKMSIYLFVAI